jgi:hypothetical protein
VDREGLKPVHIPAKYAAVPETCYGDSRGCEPSRLPHLLDSRLTDGGEVVGLTCLQAAFVRSHDN